MTEFLRRFPVRTADWPEEKIEAQLSSFHHTRRRRQRTRRAFVATMLVFGAVGTMGVLRDETGLGALATWRAEPTGAPGTLDDASLKGSHLGQRSVRFHDGSLAALRTEGTRLLVEEVTREVVRVKLSEGEVDFEVTPDANRRFVVDALDVRITVLGTKFLVSRSGERVRVAVEHGRVRVDRGGEEVFLSRGDARVFGPEDAQSASPSADSAAPASSRGSDVPQGASVDARRRFLEHHRRAQYAEAYAILSRERGVLRPGADDLMRASDAARYSGHPEEAVGYLKQIDGGHPLGVPAAFTLGRLYLSELGRPQDAAAAFARARSLAPSGPLAEDALFREIEARVKAGQAAAARELAAEYASLYPASRRRAAVDRLGQVR